MPQGSAFLPFQRIHGAWRLRRRCTRATRHSRSHAGRQRLAVLSWLLTTRTAALAATRLALFFASMERRGAAGPLPRFQGVAGPCSHPPLLTPPALLPLQSAVVTGRTWTNVSALAPELAGQPLLVRARVHTVRGKGKSAFLVLRQATATVQASGGGSCCCHSDGAAQAVCIPLHSACQPDQRKQAPRWREAAALLPAQPGCRCCAAVVLGRMGVARAGARRPAAPLPYSPRRATGRAPSAARACRVRLSDRSSTETAVLLCPFADAPPTHPHPTRPHALCRL